MNYGNGFFYLAKIGYFRLAQNGRFHPALTNGQTALMFAVASNHLDIVSMLVEAGADVNAQDNAGNYVLQVALLPYNNYGDSRIFKYLLNHGADAGRIGK